MLEEGRNFSGRSEETIGVTEHPCVCVDDSDISQANGGQRGHGGHLREDQSCDKELDGEQNHQPIDSRRDSAPAIREHGRGETKKLEIATPRAWALWPNKLTMPEKVEDIRPTHIWMLVKENMLADHKISVMAAQDPRG